MKPFATIGFSGLVGVSITICLNAYCLLALNRSSAIFCSPLPKQPLAHKAPKATPAMGRGAPMAKIHKAPISSLKFPCLHSPELISPLHNGGKVTCRQGRNSEKRVRKDVPQKG